MMDKTYKLVVSNLNASEITLFMSRFYAGLNQIGYTSEKHSMSMKSIQGSVIIIPNFQLKLVKPSS
jgi:hypothetical protein